MVCRNLVAHNSNVTAGDDGEVGILKTSLVFLKDMDLATDEDIRGTIDRLSRDAAIMDPGTFKLSRSGR